MNSFKLTACVCQFFFIVKCYGMTVRLSYVEPDIRSISMPEFINVTLTPMGDNNTLNFTLKKVRHMSPNIPLHTLTLGPDGRYTSRREILGDNENTAFYQDLNNDVVMEAKRIHPSENESPTLQFKGQFIYNGSLFTISQETRSKRDVNSQDGDDYVIQERPAMLQMYDYILPVKNKSSQESKGKQTPAFSNDILSTSHLRKRRQTTSTYYIDIVTVIDYRAYSRFLDSSNNRTDALQKLLEYYTFVITGVDLLYQGITTTNYKTRVRLTKVIVAETAKVSAFTEDLRISASPNDIIDAKLSLDAFSQFVVNSGKDVIGPYDHAMLFAGFDIFRLEDSIQNKQVVGLAYRGTFCNTDGKSSSIIEDFKGFSSIATAAHELGHSLSATHDGDDNKCSGNDHYIMSAIGPLPQEVVNQNPWRFSNCSVKYFTGYFSRLLQTTTGTSCLIEAIQADANIPDVSGTLPGLKYPPDEQCKMLQNYGGSFLCPSLKNYSLNADPSVICKVMYCKANNSNGCRGHLAADGTVCGDGKLCSYGECVSHELAPQSDVTCLYGDDKSVSLNNLNCSESMKAQPWLCYDYAERCCNSCKNYYRPIQGCEYGDRDGTCQTSHCSGGTNNLKICCATCDYGTPITTVVTTTRTRSTTASLLSSTFNITPTASLTTTSKYSTTASVSATTTVALEMTSVGNKSENITSNAYSPNSFFVQKCLILFLLFLIGLC